MNNLDKLVPSVAAGFMMIVNGLTQRKAKLAQLELANQAAAQKITEAEQKAEIEYQAAIQKIKQDEQEAELKRKMAELDLESRKLEIARQIFVLSKERLDLQQETRKNSLESAAMAADIFQPSVEIREVIIQSTLPNILQLQNVTGLELALPPPNKEEEK